MTNFEIKIREIQSDNNTEIIAIKLKRAKGKIDIGKNVGGFGIWDYRGRICIVKL